MHLRTTFKYLFAAPDEQAPHSRLSRYYLLHGFIILGIVTPPKHFFALYCIWSLLFNIIVTLYQPIAFLIGYVNHLSDFTATEFFNSLQVVFNAWACSAKVLILWALVKRLDYAGDILDQLDARLTKQQDRHKIHRTVATCNRVFLLYTLLYLSYVVITFVISIFKGTPPYQNYYPGLNWRASSFQYWCQSWLEFLSMLAAAFQNVCVDCYAIVSILPLRTHMTIFTERVRQLGRDSSCSHQQRYEDLIDCIRHHKVILSYCDMLRPLFSGTLFVQYLIMGLVVGLTFINIMMFKDFSSAFVAFFYMSAVLMETTPFSALCTFLIYDCNNLADALFESNWIDGEQRYKKTLLHFLHQLQQPITFKALNVFNISVGTNINMVKFAVSVYTVLEHLHIVDKFAKPIK